MCASVVGELVEDIKTAHKANLGVYGARKFHAEFNREGIAVARCTVERLMRAEGFRMRLAANTIPSTDRCRFQLGAR